MRVFNLRLTDQQFKLAEEIAKNESDNVSKILRKSIDIGLQIILSRQENNDNTSLVPAYEIIATRAAIETLMLLRKIAERSSPDLIEIAKKLASDCVKEHNLSELINQ